MNIKIMMMAIMVLLSTVFVSADLEVQSVSIDGTRVLELDNGNLIAEKSLIVERGEDFDVKVKVFTNTSVENLVISAEILGYEYSKYEDSLQDEVSPFDMEADDSKIVRLKLGIPNDAEKDKYDLRIRVASRKGSTEEYLIGLRLDGERHKVIITDIQAADTIVAGRSMIGNVRVENIGQDEEDSIKITLSIPELNIEDSEYVDELDEDDATTSEDLLLRIPSCTPAGTYDVVATVEYSRGYEEASRTQEITVLASDLCEANNPTPQSEEKTIVTVPTGQEVMQGKSVVYPVVISNLGSAAKTYVITVSPSVETFGTYRIDPSNVMIVDGASTKTAYVYVTIDEEAQTGLRDFKVTVTADGEAKEATLTANIVENQEASSSSSLRTGLQISLLVLVILLLILLIIFGFNKMKSSKDEDEDEDEVGQTYY